MSWKKEGVLVFRLKTLILFSLVSFLTAFLSLESSGASLPSTLYFEENKFITIENCQFTSSSTLSSLSGKGFLTLNRLRKSLGEISFTELEAEASGKIINIGQDYSFSLNRYTIRSIKPIISPDGPDLLLIPQGEVNILIPELNTSLTLSFQILKLNDWGEVEVESLELRSGPAAVKEVASISGLDLKINQVGGKIEEGRPVLTIEASLNLFNNPINLTLFYPAGLVIELGQWNYSFRGNNIKINQSTLDLSRSGGVVNQEVDASWQGIYIARGSFKLNETEIEVRDCYLDGQGFTGKIAGSAENQEFVGKISYEKLSLEIDIKHDQPKRNFLKIEGCSFPPLQSSFTLSGTLDENGYNLSVETGDNCQVKYDPLKLTASITRGQFFLSSGKYVLWLDGALSFDHDKLPKGIIQFHNLGIDTEGNFILPETGLQVDSPSPLDFGDLFKCEVSSVQFLRDSNNKLKIQFDGALSLGGDIPLNAKISFQELSVKEGPEVTLSGVKADFSLKGVARIKGELNKEEVENGKECLSGSAGLYLFGASGPLGADFGFKIYSYRSWAVAGEVSLGVPLNIPDTNLFIYSFSGGVGRNVTKKSNEFDINNIDSSSLGDENWLFMGGMQLGTAPPQLLNCYPLQLTVGFPQLSFSLYGKCTILEGPTITSTIEFNPLSPLFKFTSQTNFDLYNVINIQGGMEVSAKKENGKPAVYVAIGWPYPANAVGYSMLNGKIYGRYGLYGYASSNTVEVKANASSGFNVGIFRGDIEGELNFLINADPFLSGQVRAEGEIDVWVGAVGASGELEVQVYKKPELRYKGEVSAWVEVFGGRLKTSKNVGGNIGL